MKNKNKRRIRYHMSRIGLSTLYAKYSEADNSVIIVSSGGKSILRTVSFFFFFFFFFLLPLLMANHEWIFF